jgi:hypothetical protein
MFNSAADVLLGAEAGNQAVTKQFAQTDDADGFLDEDLL